MQLSLENKELVLSYKEVSASKSLTPYIDSFWILDAIGESDSYSSVQRCFSSGMIELVFHMGDIEAFGLYDGKWVSYPQVYFIGLNKKATLWKMRGSGRMFGVRIKPETIIQLFNAPVKSFYGKYIDASAFIGDSITPFINMVMEAANEIEMIFLTEAFFHSQIKSHEITRNYFSRAISHIRNFPDTDISELNDKSFISSRQLQRTFKDYLGMSPKAYADLLRIYYAHQRGLNKRFSITEIAYDLGYSDAAHFNKKFKAYFGLSPMKYFSQYSL